MKIAILGGGESGVGAALLAKAKGYDVFLSDKGQLGEKYKTTLILNNIPFEENQHTEEKILDADEVIKSPGIPSKADLIVKLTSLKKSIISEIEFASRYTKAKIIAITGSNGKTTTTLLTYHLLKSAGLNVGLGGNIGESFAKQVINDDFDYFVLELSSFQLDNMYSFKADIAILLNITPDHLDRYNYNFQEYVDSKFRILQNLNSEDTFIYFQENEPIVSNLKRQNYLPKMLPVSLTFKINNGAYFFENNLCFEILGEKTTIDWQALPLKGSHNAINTMCAVLAALELNINFNLIVESIKTFHNAPHRLEQVAVINDVTYINDSKATNVDSVFYALGSFERPIILIMGGVDKGNDYTQIEELVAKKVKALICLGVDNHKLTDYFGGKLDLIFEAKSINEALDLAKNISLKNDVVLLSPACASFDLFKNYEDRGDQFRAEVLRLKANTQ